MPLIGWDIFDFSSETTERNSMKLDRKQDLNVLYQVCVFRADRKNKVAALASDWLRHFRLLLWNHWTEFKETWQEARSQCPLQRLCFSGRSEKQDGRPGLWLAETFSTSPLKPLNGIQQNLKGSKISTSSTKFVFLGRLEKQDGRPGLWLAETFWTSPLKPLNGIQRNLKGSKISMSSTKFMFLGPMGKQDGSPGLWLAETFSSSPLKRLKGIQRYLTGSKISMSSTKYMFLGPIGKTRWPPWPLIGWDIFDFSSETAERNSKKLDRKQDLNVLYKGCVFRADRKNKMAALASDWLRHFRLLLWNRWTEFNKTWKEARSQRPLPSLCFWADWKNKMAALASDWLRHFRLLLWNRWMEFNETWKEARSQCPLPNLCFWGPMGKQDGGPGLWLAETFSTSPLKPLNGIQRNLTGSKISTSSTKFVFFGRISKQKMSALADSSKGWHIVLRCTICGPLGLLFSSCDRKHTYYFLASHFLGCHT